MQLVKVIPPFQMELPIGVYNGTLINFQTTGTHPFHDEIITFGYIQKNQLCIIQRCDADPISFYNKVKGTLDSLDKPFYAYNADFVKNFAKEQLELKFSKGELTDLFEPWKTLAEQAGIKWPRLDDLVGDPSQYYPVKRLHSADIPRIWNKYLKSGDLKFLDLIISQCKGKLLKGLFLLVYAPVVYGELRESDDK